MRILAIRGERLASLHEPFVVDFEAPPLAGAGLYAITGPTGAGKSTLLDAVCLALYGDTPRVVGNSGSVSIALGLADGEEDQRLGIKDPRQLLSRGSKHGHAEVDFRGQDGQRYRARWSVAQRPRASALAEPTMSLVRLSDERLLAKGRDATRREVERLVGFTFVEFQKAVLLPQGQFAEFLRADAKARADILEKVAGGEIYARLGTAAAARQKTELEALRALEAEAAGRRPLGDEERGARSSERDAAKGDVASAQGRERAAREALAWHDRADELTGAAEAAASKAAGATAALAAAGPRREELARVEEALGCRSVLADADRTERALAVAAAEEERHAAAAAACSAAAVTARRGADAAVAAAAAVDEELARTRPQLEEARRLDHLLDSARRREADAAQSARAAAAAAQGAEAGAEAARAACARLAAEREASGAWLAAHAGEGPLVTEWQRWRELIERHRKAAVRAAEARRLRDDSATPEAVDGARRAAAQADAALSAASAAAEQARSARAAAEEAVRLAERGVEGAQGSLQAARAAQGFESHRASLEPGAPCPLCGATEHPWAGLGKADALVRGALDALGGCERGREAAGRELARTREEAERAGEAQANAAATAKERAKAADLLEAELARAGRKTAEADVARAEAEADECAAALAAPLQSIGGWREALAKDPAALLRDGEGRVAAHASHRDARERAGAALADAEATRAAAGARAAELTAAAAAAAGRLREGRDEVAKVAAERGRLLGGRATAEVEQGLAERGRLAGETLDRGRREAARADVEAASTAAALTAAAARRAEGAAAANAAAAALAEALGRLGVDRPTLEGRLARGERFVTAERGALAKLEAEERDARTLLAERRGALELHASGRPARDRATALADAQRAAADAAAADQRRVAAEAALLADAKDRAALAALAPRLEAQRARAGLWSRLGDLIGSGGKGSFRAFAQGLALDALLGHANRHLEQLAPRYRLARVPGTDMDIQVLDQELGGAARSVNSLSGGETFLVSLGLALGLSGLATRAARVESLFVDEGFGTLDPETLDQAMSVLEGLQATGRIVGVISHVPELHERIGVLVQVDKLGAGRSRVRAMRLRG